MPWQVDAAAWETGVLKTSARLKISPFDIERTVELRENVTSPGGTTTRAIRELERSGVRAAFLNAITAATERSRELSERVSS